MCDLAGSPLLRNREEMARGNQRELARAKNQKKQAASGKGRNDDGLVVLVFSSS